MGVMLAAGGLHDQPYKATKTMLAAQNVFDAFRLHTNYQDGDVAFSRANPDAWDVVTALDNWLRQEDENAES